MWREKGQFLGEWWREESKFFTPPWTKLGKWVKHGTINIMGFSVLFPLLPIII